MDHGTFDIRINVVVPVFRWDQGLREVRLSRAIVTNVGLPPHSERPVNIY
jgi:hypothetical protein